MKPSTRALNVVFFSAAAALLLAAACSSSPPPSTPSTANSATSTVASSSATPVTEAASKPKEAPVMPGNGAVDKDKVKQTFRTAREQFADCYHAARIKDRNLQGDVVFRFVIAEDGHSGPLDLSKSTITDTEMLECIGKAFRALNFPKPDGGNSGHISYPISFAPGETPAASASATGSPPSSKSPTGKKK